MRGRARPPVPPFAPKGLKGQYVADLFSGHGGVARQLRRLGYAVKEWELDRGPQFDLTRPKVQRVILQDIHKSLGLAMILAPPCLSFSVARDRTCIIRARGFPSGLPRGLLSPADFDKATQGNRCFKPALKFIRCLN